MRKFLQVCHWRHQDLGPGGALSFPSLPFPPLPFPPLPSPPLEVGPLNPARGSGSGVWGEAPADKRFGAYLGQKEQLWWQQFYGFS